MFIVFPYLAVTLAIFGSLVRHFYRRSGFSNLPSEMLENGSLFWGALPWYYGIIPILIIHLMGFTIPGVMAVLHGNINMLYLAELFGKVVTLLALFGIIAFILRRFTHAGLRLLTTPLDWLVLVLLLNQVSLGLWTSYFYRWGAVWFLHTVTPWVVSLATFHPEIETVTALPLIPRLHFLNATLLIALFPFTRLVHMLTYPITYLWRRYQDFVRDRRATHKRASQ